MLFVRIAKSEISLSFNEKITSHINVPANVRIYHLVSRTNATIPAKSPAAMILAAARTYEKVLVLGQERSTIYEKVKKLNRTNREHKADSRRTGVSFFE